MAIKLKNKVITRESPPFVIAEIGNNHQGELEIAIELVKTAKLCGADAVKFQKRHTKSLYTKALYNQVYDNPDSFGKTYGEHREALELNDDDFIKLKKDCEDIRIEFMCTAFDFKSADFLNEIGINSFKIASGDLHSHHFLEHIAKYGKPIFLSTGAATLEDVRKAYEVVKQHNNEICLMQCTAAYPADYHALNLNIIKTYLNEFPDAVVGYSGHDWGILAPSIARILGATVFEKHFTLNRALKGTDHKFSLEPAGLQKVVRDLKRVDIALGTYEKTVHDSEKNAKRKMGKSIYYAKDLKAGTVLTKDNITIKCPFDGIPASEFKHFLGKKLSVSVKEDDPLQLSHVRD